MLKNLVQREWAEERKSVPKKIECRAQRLEDHWKCNEHASAIYCCCFCSVADFDRNIDLHPSKQKT